MTPTIHAETARDVDPLAGCIGTWWVVQTRSRFEQRFSDDLSRAAAAEGYEANAVVVMNDVVKLEPDAKGRMHRRRIPRPLFPGYVFLNGPADARYVAACSPWVFGVIEVNDQHRLHRELSSVVVAAGACPNLGLSPISRGIRVEITGGPLRGLQGEVQAVESGKVSLLMKDMHAAVVVEVAPELVEPLDLN